jgi:hypothetical protein
MSLFGRKPRTLGEVVRRVKAGEQRFDPSLREFLDSFYVNPELRQQAIEERPAPSMPYMTPMSPRSQNIWREFTDCKYPNGARPMVTDFTNHSLPAVFSL